MANTYVEVFTPDEKKELESRVKENKITPEEYQKLLKDSKEVIKQQEVNEKLKELEEQTMGLPELVDKKIEIIERFRKEKEGVYERAKERVNALRKEAWKFIESPVGYTKEKIEKSKEEKKKKLEKYKDDFRDSLKKKTKEKLNWIPVVWDSLWDKAWEFVWNLFDDITEIDENEKKGKGFKWWLKKAIIPLVLGFFWFKTYKEWTDKIKSELKELEEKGEWVIKWWVESIKWAVESLTGWEEKTEKKDEGSDEAEVPPTSYQENESSKEKVIEEKDKNEKRDFFYLAWVNALIWLSSVELDNNTYNQNIFNGIKRINYNELISLKWSDSEKKKLPWCSNLSENELHQFDLVLEWLISSRTEKLLRFGFKKDKLVNILKPNGVLNEKLFVHFWEDKESWKIKIKQILDELEKGSFDWESLTVEELSILYLETIPAVWLFGVKQLSSLSENISSFMFDWTSNLKEKFSNFKDNLLPKSVVEWFAKIDLNFWGKTLLDYSLEDLSKKLNIKDKKEKEKLEKLIKFKDYIKWDFQENPKMLFSEWQKQTFDSNLNYKWIIALYFVMWWKELDSISSISLPMVVLTNSHIIWDWAYTNKAVSAWYLWGYWKKVFLDWKFSLFTEEELEIIWIYKDKVVDLIMISYLKDFYSTIWLSETFNENFEVTAWAIVSWVILKKVWSKMIEKKLKKSWISIIWQRLKMAWWALILFWALTWWATMISKWLKMDSLYKDLEKAEQNPEQLIKILKEHKESMKTYEVWPKWKKEQLHVIAYKWDTPYIVFRNKIWTIKSFNSNSALRYWSEVVDIWVSAFWFEKLDDWKRVKIDWKRIIISEDWEKDFYIDLENLTNLHIEEVNSVWYLTWRAIEQVNELVKKEAWYTMGKNIAPSKLRFIKLWIRSDSEELVMQECCDIQDLSENIEN